MTPEENQERQQLLARIADLENRLTLQIAEKVDSILNFLRICDGYKSLFETHIRFVESTANNPMLTDETEKQRLLSEAMSMNHHFEKTVADINAIRKWLKSPASGPSAA